MNDHKATTAINAAVIVLGSYHVPASVAFGAIVGASLFVLSRRAYGAITKAWLFAVSFLGGIFGSGSTEEIINWLLPRGVLHINEFTAAALFSALVVVALQKLIAAVEHLRLPRSIPEAKPEEEHE